VNRERATLMKSHVWAVLFPFRNDGRRCRARRAAL
jgi:hypothetical protein